jgi:hypothetical protein
MHLRHKTYTPDLSWDVEHASTETAAGAHMPALALKAALRQWMLE